MFDLYTVQIPERLDQWAFRTFGVAAGIVEAVLGANPGLALEGPGDLEVGRVLRLPRTASSSAPEVVRLWT